MNSRKVLGACDVNLRLQRLLEEEPAAAERNLKLFDDEVLGLLAYGRTSPARVRGDTCGGFEVTIAGIGGLAGNEDEIVAGDREAQIPTMSAQPRCPGNGARSGSQDDRLPPSSTSRSTARC